MEKISHEQKLQHLYWRAGFGPGSQNTPDKYTIKKAVKHLMKESEPVRLLEAALPRPVSVQAAMKNGELRRQLQQERRQAFEELNQNWLNRMATAPEQLREKLTLFWHGHFACRLRDPRMAQVQHNTLRKHALGKFSDLLFAISKDPGMLQFLNNQQNHKQHPNENFAREVLELFTLGRGHYTEQDIKEAARAFTGWGFNLKGEFVFRERQHDKGMKTFMGRKGNFKGEDILQLVLENPATAEFLTGKLYAYFVSDVPDTERLRELSNQFYTSGYYIAGLLENIFTSEWFYSPEVIGSRIKSPVELLVGLQRKFDVTFADTRSAIILQKALGQVLFQPPNVSGWAGGRNWVDSSTLAYRLRIGPALLQDAAFEVSVKPDDDAEPTKPVKQQSDGLRIARAKASLTALQTAMEKVKDTDLTETLSKQLLQLNLKADVLRMLEQSIPAFTSRPEKIRVLTLRFLSLPEYQLC
ncbi:DUF1800 domain-containing protein [Pontibacter sp. MBLB2868]|uniref:DUF1800 domain-containing protein n=1 Tax=Pontibacter sp. MBLB2868 TaxID=3451555 RepID=UPI003F755391